MPQLIDSPCSCHRSAAFFADATYRCPKSLRHLVDASAQRYPEHFDSEMLECSEEDFGAGNGGYYRCNQCGEWWNLVFSDDECRQAIFGVRSSEEIRQDVILRGVPDKSVSLAREAILTLLLGQSSCQCARAGCERYALAGVALCPEHFGFPW